MAGEIVLSTAYHHGVRIAVPGSKDRVHLPLQVSVRDSSRDTCIWEMPNTSAISAWVLLP